MLATVHVHAALYTWVCDHHGEASAPSSRPVPTRPSLATLPGGSLRRSRSRSREGGAHYGMPERDRTPPRRGLQLFVAGFNFITNERVGPPLGRVCACVLPAAGHTVAVWVGTAAGTRRVRRSCIPTLCCGCCCNVVAMLHACMLHASWFDNQCIFAARPCCCAALRIVPFNRILLATWRATWLGQ